jgi:hypothetical protein
MNKRDHLIGQNVNILIGNGEIQGFILENEAVKNVIVGIRTYPIQTKTLIMISPSTLEKINPKLTIL